MKPVRIFFALVISIPVASCKKDYTSDPPLPAKEKKAIVSTLAGDGTAAFKEGTFLLAEFNSPGDLVFSVDGFYVADIENHMIRKISSGQVTIYAGSDSSGILNGPGGSALFKNPWSITTDPVGNLFISDAGDPRIRKISDNGIVSFYAGSEQLGFKDGDAATAQFGNSSNIVADEHANIYVSDNQNNRIRKISNTGQVTTIAGTGQVGFRDGDGSIAEFHNPGGITLDKSGNLYVADRGNYRIRKITPSGQVSTIAGIGRPGRADGKSDQAEFTVNVHDLVSDEAGNIYLADDHRIRKLSISGMVSTIAGNDPGYKDGDGSEARFNLPLGLAIDPLGTVYIADAGNNRIRKIDFK